MRVIVSRLFDMAGSAVAVTLLAPVLTGIALLIAICDGRPVLFRQKRIGRNGAPFWILKFRTMTNNRAGASITAAGDRRVTALGKRLRQFKLDELPQLLNVLRGEMSMIGPRPEVPEFVQFDDELWRAVLQAKPGITDLASLVYRDEERVLAGAANPEAYYRTAVLPAKLRLNLHYLKSRSMTRDARLLWLTARYSFFPRGFDSQRVAQSFGV
jgi:lipopolysaccharide/colanic/teichoic acid biosynthesis glycosyltransferase